MIELELQGEYVMDFFCRRKDGLGYREVRNNAVTPDLFIPADLQEFLKENSRTAWNNLLRKSTYNGDEQKLLRAIMNSIKEKIEAASNVAIFLNRNNKMTFEGESLQLLYVSGTELRGDADFEKNIFSAVEEVSYSFHHEGKKVFGFRPDLSFFLNGIFLGYAELKSNFNNQTARTHGRDKVTGDYLEAVWEYSKIAAGNDVSQTLRRQMLRPFEKSIHIVSTDINDTYILRNPSQFFEEARRGFDDGTITISSFRPNIEKVFKPLPTVAVVDESTPPKVRFEEAMRSLYSKKMVEKEILYYNFMAYTYKSVTETVNGHKVQKKVVKDNTGFLICPRPKQKFGCDRIVDRVQEFLDHEREPNYFINKLRAELQSMNAPQDLIDKIVAERDSYCNNKYVYSLLLQYAAGFGKSNIIGWTALQLKDLRFNDEWVYDKILLVVDRLQLRDQLDTMMRNMNIDKSMFVEARDQDTFVAALSDKRRIIVVNIQKFWELKNAIQAAGKDFTDKRVAFLIDEIHRSNTDDVHQEMFSAFDELQDIFDENGGFITRGSLKKNLIVGFTATPSERVLARFGEFYRGSNFNQLWKPFDCYSMKEAIADGYILDPTKHIIPVPAKMYFELEPGVLQAVTQAMNSGDDAKVKFAKKQIYENVDRMEAISKFIVNRLLTLIYGKIRGTGKAMLAVSSIPIAIQYCKIIRRIYKERTASGTLAKYADAPVAIVYSDNQKYESCASMNNGVAEEKVIENFKTAKNGLIIVVDKLQTGFDEQKLHTLFLDKEIKDINAIQTISRVNRTTKYKEECHIVDFSFGNVNEKNIRDAFAKYCGMCITDFDPISERKVVEEIYRGLVQQPVYIRWFERYSASKQNREEHTALCMDMDADIRAWIKATIKAHEEWLASLSDDEKKQLESFDDPAKQLYHSIGRYNSRMTLLQGVIELDAIYANADFIDFWQRYCFIYRSMLDKQNALGTVKTTYDGELGLLVGEEIEIEEPGEPGGEGGEPKPKPHPGQKRGIANIFEVLAKMNETEAEREQEMQFWFAQIKDLFDFLKSDGKLVAKLRDSNFTREQIDKEYNIAIRRYLRQTDDQKVKKLIDENKEMLLEYFKEHLDNPEQASPVIYDTDFNYMRIAAEPEE
jgi:type I restriction enzyme R subunit